MSDDGIVRSDVTELDVVTDLGPDEARTLTDEICADVGALWDKIATAYTRRAWAALDYASWDEYCIREFGTSRIRLPREERPEMVASLRHSGLSIRAIASATGIDKNTVQADLAKVSEIHTPKSGEVIDAEVITDPRPITGLDGKTYPPKPKPDPKPEPVIDAETLAKLIELDKRIDAADERIRQSRLERAADFRRLSALLSQEEEPLCLDQVKVIAKALEAAARLIEELIEECCVDTDAGDDE